MYRSNQDYYRGKVRSVYEKEPMFREFVRNIPLSEMNFYEHRNLSVLKQRFNTMVQARHGMDAATKYDPYTPSAVSIYNTIYNISTGYLIELEKKVCENGTVP